jgi:hypothetical protein
MSKVWLLEGKPYDPKFEDIPSEYVGFVYRITDTETGEMYIGQKRFRKTKTLPVTKTRKRRKKTLVESDWRTYHSSSEVIKENVAAGHSDRYRREILRFGYSKGDLSLIETILQIKNGVLFKDEYLNGIINCRIHQKHISERLKRELLEDPYIVS